MSQYEPVYDSFRRNPNTGYVPSDRMSVSASVYLPGSEVDMYTGQLKPDHQRRRRTQSKKLEKERLEREEKRLRESVEKEMNKGGVRISMRFGLLVMAVLLFVCGLTILYQQGQIASRQKEINRLDRAIAECREANEALNAQVEAASDPAVICYAAAQNLNMIPASAAHAIHLDAVDTRPLETANRVQQAAALQPQSTQVPVIASN